MSYKIEDLYNKIRQLNDILDSDDIDRIIDAKANKIHSEWLGDVGAYLIASKGELKVLVMSDLDSKIIDGGLDDMIRNELSGVDDEFLGESKHIYREGLISALAVIDEF